MTNPVRVGVGRDFDRGCVRLEGRADDVFDVLEMLTQEGRPIFAVAGGVEILPAGESVQDLLEELREAGDFADVDLVIEADLRRSLADTEPPPPPSARVA